MPSRILIRGQTAWQSRGWERPVAAPVGRDRAGNPVPLTPVAPDSVESPYRAGEPIYDPVEQVTYRAVPFLDVSQGWGTALFWQRRWHAAQAHLITLCQMGMLDAAIDANLVRRYRCRDEHKAKAWIATQRSEGWQRKQEQIERGYALPVKLLNGWPKGKPKRKKEDHGR